MPLLSTKAKQVTRVPSATTASPNRIAMPNILNEARASRRDRFPNMTIDGDSAQPRIDQKAQARALG